MKFEHLNIDHGLSNGNVRDILQDTLGFMWFATDDGLNMYDGYDFTVFKNDTEDSTSISDNRLNAITEGYNGNIWIATQNGLNVYSRKKKIFKRFFHEENNPLSLSSNIVNCLLINDNNNLWVGAKNGLNFFNRKDSSFRKYLHHENQANSLADNDINCILEDHKGRLWIGTKNGLSWYDPDKEMFVNFYHSTKDKNSLSSNTITCLFEDSEQNLWVGVFDGGLNKFNPSDSTFIRFSDTQNAPLSLSNDYIYSINEDKNGSLIVTTDYGLNVINKEKTTINKYYYDPKDENSLSSNIIVSSYFDRNDKLWVGTIKLKYWFNSSSSYFDINDGLWIGTRYGGVNIYDPERNDFKHFKRNELNEYSLSSNIVTSFAEDEKGNFWVGTDGGGLNYYDRTTGNFIIQLRHEENNPNSLANNKVLAIEIDQKGRVWIGMWNGGINVYNPVKRTFKHYEHHPNNPSSLSGNKVFDILEDSQGNIWIATWENGFNKFNPKTNNFTRYDQDPKKNTNSFDNSTGNHLIEDSQGKIWIATQNKGLYMFDPKSGTFINYSQDGISPGISSNSIHSIFEDSKNRIWIGTNGGGLNLLNRKTKIFTSYQKKDGLPDNTIKGILEDGKGNLWLSTNKGMSMFNPEKESFTNYDVNDGLQSNQFNRWAYLHLSNGELLFGGINGFNLFKPDDIKENTHIPPVYITDIKLFNKPAEIGENNILSQNILYTDEIILDYNQNYLTLEYVALNYRQSSENKYKYILEGLQENWVNAGTQRKVTYSNLSPGKYTFKVIASNNDGVWNTKGRSLSIIIRPPFWSTIWFKIFAVIVTVLIIGIVFRIRTYSITKQNKKLAKINEELKRTNLELDKFVYSASHNLRAPLTSILGLINITKHEAGNSQNGEVVNYLSMMEGSIKKLDQHISDITDYSRNSRLQLNKTQIDLQGLINEIIDSLRFYKNFDEIDIKVNIDNHLKLLSDKYRLKIIISNLLSNAIKYYNVQQKHPYIKIEVYAKNDKVLLKVIDNGKGIEQPYKDKIFDMFFKASENSDGAGLGLYITKETVRTLGGEIFMESEVLKGTTFTIELPISI